MRAISAWILVFVLIFVTYEAFGQGSCPATFKAVGCYKDNRKMRILPNHIMNARPKIDWTNYHNFLPRLVCRCAEKAKKENFRFFGIQYYGECWAGKNLPSMMKKKSSCIDGHFQKCQKTGPDRICSGKAWTNFVFDLGEVSVQEPLTSFIV
ncbi:hypothetical protein OS493_009751 [Desmophyllum pertusum]|uniref:Uncharacterized protein n=1 Tax=Desmophyllum pertusum TaxID=174260 RepID=A0A9X0CM06_9CNID|nr:hypothetical protein OS493_009751 [Desmophyllum pertusum]